MKHKYQRSVKSGFYLRTTKQAVFLGEGLEEAKIAFRTKFNNFLDKRGWWIEYCYADWFTKYCNSKVNSEEGWTGIDRSADFL